MKEQLAITGIANLVEPYVRYDPLEEALFVSTSIKDVGTLIMTIGDSKKEFRRFSKTLLTMEEKKDEVISINPLGVDVYFFPPLAKKLLQWIGEEIDGRRAKYSIPLPDGVVLHIEYDRGDGEMLVLIGTKDVTITFEENKDGIKRLRATLGKMISEKEGDQATLFQPNNIDVSFSPDLAKRIRKWAKEEREKN